MAPEISSPSSKSISSSNDKLQPVGSIRKRLRMLPILPTVHVPALSLIVPAQTTPIKTDISDPNQLKGPSTLQQLPKGHKNSWGEPLESLPERSAPPSSVETRSDFTVGTLAPAPNSGQSGESKLPSGNYKPTPDIAYVDPRGNMQPTLSASFVSSNLQPTINWPDNKTWQSSADLPFLPQDAESPWYPSDTKEQASGSPNSAPEGGILSQQHTAGATLAGTWADSYPHTVLAPGPFEGPSQGSWLNPEAVILASQTNVTNSLSPPSPDSSPLLIPPLQSSADPLTKGLPSSPGLQADAAGPKLAQQGECASWLSSIQFPSRHSTLYWRAFCIDWTTQAQPGIFGCLQHILVAYI